MAETEAPLILGIGGTAHPRSTSELVLRVALAHAETLGARTQLIEGPDVAALPLYVPGRHERLPGESRLVEAVRACDGLIVSTPGYHGSLSGPIKNALDLIEDTARDDRPYLDGRAFGAIVTAFGWQAGGTTLVTMRSIAHALRAWPTPFGATLNVSEPLFDEAGAMVDERSIGQLQRVAAQVVEFARWRAAGLRADADPLGL